VEAVERTTTRPAQFGAQHGQVVPCAGMLHSAPGGGAAADTLAGQLAAVAAGDRRRTARPPERIDQGSGVAP
jgi:hypothetical protein